MLVGTAEDRLERGPIDDLDWLHCVQCVDGVVCRVLDEDLLELEHTLSGDLTEAAVKEMLTMGGRRRDGSEAPSPAGAKGSVKFWIKDGVLTKYETQVSGKLSFNGNEMDLDRTTTTEFKDVGASTVEVPEDAKKKIESAPAPAARE